MTSPIRTQLEECFCVVFPELSREEAATAEITSVESWDSLAALTLVSVIEEQFSLRIPLEQIPELVSFEKIAQFLDTGPCSAAA